MGQPRVASATWRERNRRISQDFYEIVGQQILQTSASKPMRAWSHVKILNRVFKSTPDIPSETERNQLNFSASGMPLSYVHLTVRQRETSFSSCGGFRGPDLRPCLPYALSFRSACGQSLLLGLFRA